MKPRVLVSTFLLASDMGGSSVTIDLTKHLDADLRYVVAEAWESPQAIFAGISPTPEVIVNPHRSKPHMRAGSLSWRELWNRNWDIHRDALWIRRQQRFVRQWSPDVVCSMTTLMKRADIFVVHFLRAQSFLETYGYSSTLSDKLIQRLDLKERHTLSLERENMKKENHRYIMVSSEATKRALQEHYDVPDSRIVIIRNAVDDQYFAKPSPAKKAAAREKLGIRPDETVVLFVGRSPERKGIDYLISAVESTGRSNLRILLVGFKDNRYVNDLLKKTRSSFTLVGEVSICELSTVYYAAADLFVLPSRVEPYGGAVLEAMACGVPPIVTPQVGAAEIIRHGETGFVLPGEHPRQELADLLCQLLDSRHTLDRLGVAARANIEQSLSWKEQCAKLNGLVVSLGESSRGAKRW